MATATDNAVTIVGAGLAGSLMALILQRSGYSVTMYERYNDVRQIPSAGRSINLVLTSRGLRAMHALGDGRLVKDMYDLSVPVTGRVMHQVGYSGAYGKHGLGFLVSMLATLTMEGMALLVFLAGSGLVKLEGVHSK